ncbi:MAG: hypothetical protein ABJB95_04225, partial [Gemmatimonadales bacterium]
EALQRALAAAANEIEDLARSIFTQLRSQERCDDSLGDQRPRNVLVVQSADLLERVGEWIVPDIVEQRRRSDDGLLVLTYRRGIFGFAKERQSPPREMVRAERVLESRVRGARVDEIRPTELANVSQTLEDFGVDEL